MQTCPACGHQYDGKRPEQKINRREALQRYDRLRDVQADILWALFQFTVMSLQQIGDVFFDAAEPEKRKELAGRHLHVLQSAGFIETHEPEARHHFKKFFSLTATGMFICQVEEKMDARKVKRVKESKASTLLSSIHIGHHLAIVDVMSSFLRAERHGLGELIYYAGDREVTYIYSAVGSRRRLQPDSTFMWSANGKGYLTWLEFENGRASVKDLEEKIHKYLLFESAGYNRGDTFKAALAVNQFPPLVVVAAKRSQLPGLHRAIIHGVLAAHIGTLGDVATRVVIGLASLDDIKQHGVLGDEVFDCPLQGLTRRVGFESLFGLR